MTDYLVFMDSTHGSRLPPSSSWTRSRIHGTILQKNSGDPVVACDFGFRVGARNDGLSCLPEPNLRLKVASFVILDSIQDPRHHIAEKQWRPYCCLWL